VKKESPIQKRDINSPIKSRAISNWTESELLSALQVLNASESTVSRGIMLISFGGQNGAQRIQLFCFWCDVFIWYLTKALTSQQFSRKITNRFNCSSLLSSTFGGTNGIGGFRLGSRSPAFRCRSVARRFLLLSTHLEKYSVLYQLLLDPTVSFLPLLEPSLRHPVNSHNSNWV
jgi:hypothetical protein